MRKNTLFFVRWGSSKEISYCARFFLTKKKYCCAFVSVHS